MLLRNHQRVPLSSREDIEEGIAIIVFKDFPRWHRAFNNLAEETIAHAANSILLIRSRAILCEGDSWPSM